MKCLFCKFVKEKEKLALEGEIYLVGENAGAIAILDAFPVSDGHTLLVTKKAPQEKQHFANISEVDEESWKYLLLLMRDIIAKLEMTFQPSGFNIISNMNEIASQSIFHLHIHVIPKYEKGKGFIWTSKPELKCDLAQVARKLK